MVQIKTIKKRRITDNTVQLCFRTEPIVRRSDVFHKSTFPLLEHDDYIGDNGLSLVKKILAVRHAMSVSIHNYGDAHANDYNTHRLLIKVDTTYITKKRTIVGIQSYVTKILTETPIEKNVVKVAS